MSNPRAFTLVEMLVSISVGSVLMVLAIGMVHRTMRNESAARAHQEIERTATRLSRQFRHDIHHTQSLALETNEADRPSLRLLLPAQVAISYRITDRGLRREQQQMEGRAPARQEFYKLPADHALQFTELKEPARVGLTLVENHRLVGVRPQVKLHVEAVIGQFLQLRPPGEDNR